MKTICNFEVLAEPTSSFLSLTFLKQLGKISHDLMDDAFAYQISSSAEEAFRATGQPVGNYILKTGYADMASEYRVASFPIAGVSITSGSTEITGWDLYIVDGVSWVLFDGTQQEAKFQVAFTASLDEDKQTTLKRADDIISWYRNFGGTTTDLKPNPYAKYGRTDYSF